MISHRPTHRLRHGELQPVWLQRQAILCLGVWTLLGLLLVTAACVAWNSRALTEAQRTVYIVSAMVEREGPSVQDSIESAKAVLDALNRTHTVERASSLLDSFLKDPFAE